MNYRIISYGVCFLTIGMALSILLFLTITPATFFSSFILFFIGMVCSAVIHDKSTHWQANTKTSRMQTGKIHHLVITQGTKTYEVRFTLRTVNNHIVKQQVNFLCEDAAIINTLEENQNIRYIVGNGYISLPDITTERLY